MLLEKSYWVFYFMNVWWDHIPDANCLGVKGEHCSIDAALGGYVFCEGFNRPGVGLMLIMLFNFFGKMSWLG